MYNIGITKQEAKLDILQKSALNRKMTLDAGSELSSIASKMDGFVASDIARLVEKAAHVALAGIYLALLL